MRTASHRTRNTSGSGFTSPLTISNRPRPTNCPMSHVSRVLCVQEALSNIHDVLKLLQLIDFSFSNIDVHRVHPPALRKTYTSVATKLCSPGLVLVFGTPAKPPPQIHWSNQRYGKPRQSTDAFGVLTFMNLSCNHWIGPIESENTYIAVAYTHPEIFTLQYWDATAVMLSEFTRDNYVTPCPG